MAATKSLLTNRDVTVVTFKLFFFYSRGVVIRKSRRRENRDFITNDFARTGNLATVSFSLPEFSLFTFLMLYVGDGAVAVTFIVVIHISWGKRAVNIFVV